MIGECDWLRLPVGVALADGRLHDDVRGTSWPVNGAAAFVLAREGKPLASVVGDVAAAFDVPVEQARADVLRFAWELNALALVDVVHEASWLRRLHDWIALAARLAPSGAVPGSLTRRRAVDTTSAVRGLLGGTLATLPRAIVVAVVATVLGAHVAALVGGVGLALAVAAGIGAGAGMAVHEGAHAALLTGVPSALVTRGRRTFVLHAPVDPARRRRVAVAGPGVAAAVGAALVLTGVLASVPEAAALGCPLAAHAIALTVLVGDGRVACGL